MSQENELSVEELARIANEPEETLTRILVRQILKERRLDYTLLIYYIDGKPYRNGTQVFNLIERLQSAMANNDAIGLGNLCWEAAERLGKLRNSLEQSITMANSTSRQEWVENVKYWLEMIKE